MQVKALDLFYDVCSEVLFKNKIDFNTCFDTYREKRYILHKTFECQMLCIRLDVHVHSEHHIRDDSTSLEVCELPENQLLVFTISWISLESSHHPSFSME